MPQLLQSEDEFSLVAIQKYWPRFTAEQVPSAGS